MSSSSRRFRCSPVVVVGFTALLFVALWKKIFPSKKRKDDSVKPGWVVGPSFDNTKLYVNPPIIPVAASLQYLHSQGVIQYHSNACLDNTDMESHSLNHLILNATEVLRQDPMNTTYVPGYTYWFNEFLHVGHVPYDSVLIQVLQSIKLDRIVAQRDACVNLLCDGVGSFRSFFGAYFAAAIGAGQNEKVPIYIRWSGKDPVSPYYVSTLAKGYIINASSISSRRLPDSAMTLTKTTCFEHMIRRGQSNYYGNFPGAVSPEAVRKFKAKAYSSTANIEAAPLPSTFQRNPPYTILFSSRGPKATRHMRNEMDVLEALRLSFPLPDYTVVHLNNSDPTLTAEAQIVAVATANVVITNHGAFEGNILYMRNGTLLVELSGNYRYEPEFKFFQLFAQTFGVYYVRYAHATLDGHKYSVYKMLDNEVQDVIEVVQKYFSLKPFLHNVS